MEERKNLDLTAFAEKVQTLREAIAQVIVGQEENVEMLLTAILAGGHVLIEGVPGVAKTLLVKLMARLIDAQFSRVQFTPDLMPSDVLGTSVFNMKTQEFQFHAGPVFADVVLVDEVNRAPAKTQAALFEVMEERQATIDGITHPMSPLYTILATQNPVEQEGTYNPSAEEELRILQRHHENVAFTDLSRVQPVITKDELLQLRTLLSEVYAETSLLQYVVDIVQQTRKSRVVYLGASPRASVAILQSAKAYALLQGRDYLTPDDVKAVVPAVLQHRLVLTAEAEMEGYTPQKVALRLLDKVEVPK